MLARFRVEEVALCLELALSIVVPALTNTKLLLPLASAPQTDPLPPRVQL